MKTGMIILGKAIIGFICLAPILFTAPIWGPLYLGYLFYEENFRL